MSTISCVSQNDQVDETKSPYKLTKMSYVFSVNSLKQMIYQGINKSTSHQSRDVAQYFTSYHPMRNTINNVINRYRYLSVLTTFHPDHQQIFLNSTN